MALQTTGIAVGASTVTVNFSCSKLMIMATADAVIKINEHPFVIKAKTDNFYETIECEFDEFVIVSGTVNYLVFD